MVHFLIHGRLYARRRPHLQIWFDIATLKPKLTMLLNVSAITLATGAFNRDNEFPISTDRQYCIDDYFFKGIDFRGLKQA